jgi:tryptophan synthase alpha chain
MGYYNPILQMGIMRFARRASEAGVDGAIVPDLPPEEAEELRAALSSCGVDLVFLLAPTSDPTRIDTVARQASGFLYLVSLVGVTGARERLPSGLEAFCEQVRTACMRAGVALPLAVGFGIGTPEQAARVAGIADGVIVGSALIRAIAATDEANQDPTLAAREFVQSLRRGIDSETI